MVEDVNEQVEYIGELEKVKLELNHNPDNAIALKFNNQILWLCDIDAVLKLIDIEQNHAKNSMLGLPNKFD